MKLKILIVDYTTHHPEVVGALRSSFADHEVRLVVTSSFQEKFSGDFSFDPTATLIMPKKLAIDKWLIQLAPVFAEQDIIIFSTALRDSLLLKTLGLKTPAKKVAFIHNTHYFTEKFPLDIESFRTVFGAPRNTLRTWSEFLKMRFRFVRRKFKHLRSGTRFSAFAERVDYFCFGSEPLASYFSQLTGLNNVVTLPTFGDLPIEPLLRPAYEGILRIAIVGLVSPERKNYLEVIRALAAASFAAPVELHILGRCPQREYGEQITALIQQIVDAKFTVFFDPDCEYIPAGELRRRLLPIHLLLSPIHLNTSFHSYLEQYGLTKYSGTEADCVRYNRPLLLPSAYRCSPQVAPFVIGYESAADLVGQINTLLRADTLTALNQRSGNLSVHELAAISAKTLLEKCMGRAVARP